MDLSLHALCLQFLEIPTKPDTKIFASHECETFFVRKYAKNGKQIWKVFVDVVTNLSTCGSCSQQCQLRVYLLGILAMFSFRTLLINLIGVRHWKGMKIACWSISTICYVTAATFIQKYSYKNIRGSIFNLCLFYGFWNEADWNCISELCIVVNCFNSWTEAENFCTSNSVQQFVLNKKV